MSQYFVARSVCRAPEMRLEEGEDARNRFINAFCAVPRLKDASMHIVRRRMIERLKGADLLHFLSGHERRSTDLVTRQDLVHRHLHSALRPQQSG
jgi:hypothetical protein